MRSEPPLILAFDTSAAHCAAALVQGGRVRAQRIEPMARGQAERLLPLLEAMLAEGGATWADLDALAVCTGPGNFTGPRLSVAAARGLALARGIPAIGVTLFEALAFGHPGAVLVTLEDRRGGLFAQRFRDSSPVGPPTSGDLAALGPVGPETLCLGFRATGVARHLGCAAGSEAATADPAALARAAAARLAAGDPPRPAPLYLRRPDAAPSSEPATVILDDA